MPKDSVEPDAILMEEVVADPLALLPDSLLLDSLINSPFLDTIPLE
jgi:hypothetical protein